MSWYVVGIGGTGSKCIEAIIQLASIGLIENKKLKILFIDADETNGNLQRAKNSLKIYQDCYKLFQGKQQECPWMSTEITSYGVWSPFSNASVNKRLGAFFSYDTIKQTSPALANLFDVLYTEDEKQVSLEVGFRGRPAIGSGIMTQINLEKLNEEPWRSFIRDVQNDVGSGDSPKIILCGSIFGGTGASGLPTIGRLISNKLEKDGVRNKVKLGSVFALPYFNFPQAPQDEEVYASPDLFLLNTEAALKYYREQAQQFDNKYLIGNQTFEKLGEFSVGKDTQLNRPHFVELYAGFAALHFFSGESEEGVHTVTRSQSGVLQWSDIPRMLEVKGKFVNSTRFAFIWLADFKNQLLQGKSKGIKELDGLAWFDKFFQGIGLLGRKTRKNLPDLSDDQQQKAIKIIDEWCEDFLRWVSEIHQCDNELIQLFKAREYFSAGKNVNSDNFAKLLHGDSRAKEIIDKDTSVNLKNTIGELDVSNFGSPNQGVAGLAKAIYVCCKL